MKHTLEKVDHSLQLHEELHLQQPGWIFQRIGWILFFLFVIGAALGIFGTGILSNKVAYTDGNRIVYQHFGRFESKMEIKFRLNVENGFATVAIPQKYFDAFELEKIVPEPYQQQIINANTIYYFKSNTPLTINFYLIPQKVGAIQVNFNVNNSDIHLSHFIYP